MGRLFSLPPFLPKGKADKLAGEELIQQNAQMLDTSGFKKIFIGAIDQRK